VGAQSKRISPVKMFNISSRDRVPETSSSASLDPDVATILASLKEIIALGDQRLDSILGAIAEAALRFTGASGAAIAMWKDGAMVCRARSGETAPPLGAHLGGDTGISGECLRTGKTEYCIDTEDDPLVDVEVCRSLGLRSIAVLPVQGWRGINGILEVFSTEPAAFTQQHLAFLQQLTALAERARATQPYGATPASKARVEEPQDVGLLPGSDRVRDVAAVLLGRRARPFLVGGIGLVGIALLGSVIWLGWRGPVEASLKPKVQPTTVGTVVSAHPPDNDPVWKPNPGGESVLPSKTFAGIPVKLASKVDAIPEKPTAGEISATNTQADRPLLSPEAALVVAAPAKASDKASAQPVVESFAEPPSLALPAPSSAGLGGVLTSPVTATPQLSVVAVSKGISGGQLLRRVSPVYPSQALLLRLQGTVILAATIYEDGTIHDVSAVKGSPALVKAATEAVLRWRYAPYQLNGKPVKTQTQITIDFKLP